MRTPLPPLTSLRAFEAAARHLSFTAAAAELNVTPAAISHQIKTLESYLGVALFHRLTRALRLTEAAEAALPEITQGFAHLARGVEQMRAHDDTLRISVGPSFGVMWLVPRLERFRLKHPEIEIRLDGTDRLADLARGDADVAIRYGGGDYKGVQVDLLFHQINVPVCSPSLRDGPNPLQVPEDLRHHTLLHINWMDAEAGWRMWLLAAGLEDVDATRGPRFSEESMAIQAAIEGQGVALVGQILAEDFIATGQLVRAFAPSYSAPLDFAYYLVTPDGPLPPKSAAFRDWLLDEVQTAPSDTKSPV